MSYILTVTVISCVEKDGSLACLVLTATATALAYADIDCTTLSCADILTVTGTALSCAGSNCHYCVLYRQ